MIALKPWLLKLPTLKRRLQKYFPSLVGASRSQKGVALLLATFSLSLILYIAMEVQYETQIEYMVNSQAVAKLKAYYAARSGVELSLLRIKMFQKMKAQFGSQLQGQQASMLDMIWNFPFAWPPVLPAEANSVGQDELKKIVKEAKMDASYLTTISDEGTKIDINDLVSGSKTIREATKKMLMQIFENEITTQSSFAKNNQDFRAEDLINNIIDWLDANTTTEKGGDEKSLYADFETDTLPPNRQFRSLEELRMVAGMNDEIFDLLSPKITIYGAKGINPNTAPSEVIQALHSSITNEVVTEVLKRRQDPQGGGQFKDAADFWGFLDSKGARVPKEIQDSTPITVESAMNFRIKSVGSYNNAVAEIEAITYDIPRSAALVAKAIKKESPTPTPLPDGTGRPLPTASPTPAAAAAPAIAKGPPRIVSWTER